MIKTKKFKLTNKEYLQIILRNYLGRRKWVIILFIFFLLLGIVQGNLFLILFPPIFTIILVTTYWQHAYSPKNKIFFKERYLEIDDDFLIGYLDDGTIDKINLDNIISFKKGKDCFLLYISKGQFLYTPFTCFEKDSDIQALEKIIKKHLTNQYS